MKSLLAFAAAIAVVVYLIISGSDAKVKDDFARCRAAGGEPVHASKGTPLCLKRGMLVTPKERTA